MQTYLDFKNELRREIWPAGEPEKLRVAHDKFFLAAMIDLQKWDPCLRANNVTIFLACNMGWERWKSWMDMPNGKVYRIYTIVGDNWQDKVWYWSREFVELENWASSLNGHKVPVNEGMPVLPVGNKYPERATDVTDGRARVGAWAIWRHRLYLAPFIQSNEKVVLEWEGQKYKWEDGDPVDTDWWTQDVKEAVKSFVLERHEFWYGDRARAKDFKADYATQLSDLMWECREKTKEQDNEEVPVNNEYLRAEDLEDESTAVEELSYAVCVTGDSGLVDQPLEDVSAAMQAENPGRIILNGDISYGDEYQDVVGDFFTDLGIIYPSIGNHDLDFQSTLVKYQAYFADTLKGNKRYYDFVYGPMHFFVLATDPREVDGGYVDATTSTQASIMGEWLRLKLAMSTAKYKIVVGHHAPYTSDVSYTPGNLWMRWPFQAWGATMYLNSHGHVFEHVRVSDFDYVTIGLGGHSIRNFGANTSGTILKQYNTDYGFVKLIGDCDQLNVQLKNRNSELIYEFDIEA